MSYMETYKEWCTNPYFDENTKAELAAIGDDAAEIEDRFYRQLEFGTGGLRGVIGAGTNRMNIYTVRQATQGLANYILSQNGQEKGVAIAHDSRIMSTEFADEAALCLNANGIKAYVFDSLRPTPELSFAVRELGCISGIVITASHNPREYNGYKVYWEDGAQITPPHDKNILAEVAKVTSFDQVKTMKKEDAVAAGLYKVIGKEIDDRYMEELKKQSIHQEVIKEMAKDIRIVYTPLHGTGNLPVRRVLKELGFEQVYVVKEQELPDGNFPCLAARAYAVPDIGGLRVFGRGDPVSERGLLARGGDIGCPAGGLRDHSRRIELGADICDDMHLPSHENCGIIRKIKNGEVSPWRLRICICIPSTACWTARAASKSCPR